MVKKSERFLEGLGNELENLANFDFCILPDFRVTQFNVNEAFFEAIQK